MSRGIIPTDDRIYVEFPWAGDAPREGFANGWPFPTNEGDQQVEKCRRAAYLTSCGADLGFALGQAPARKRPFCECEDARHFEDAPSWKPAGHAYGDAVKPLRLIVGLPYLGDAHICETCVDDCLPGMLSTEDAGDRIVSI